WPTPWTKPPRPPGCPATFCMTRCAPGGWPTSKSAAAASSPASTWTPSSPGVPPELSTRALRTRGPCPHKRLRLSAGPRVLAPCPCRSQQEAQMRSPTTAADRFRAAQGLPATLDAACDAFEQILTVIAADEQATSTGLALTFLFAATQAANG